MRASVSSSSARGARQDGSHSRHGQLDPWARVRVDGKDIGLWDEAGIPEGTHNVTYKSHDGSKEKSVELTIKGGARAKLSW